MSTHQLTYDDLQLVEDWLRNPTNDDMEAILIARLALQHLKLLMKKDMSRADLLKYLRMQMGIDPKSEKLKAPSSNQFPGSAIFRR